MTKLICGLGNPGVEYARTRHNLGFVVAEELARRSELAWSRSRLLATVARGTLAGQDTVLAKPTTYMNDSGIAVSRLLKWYKIATTELLIVCDDLDLPFGSLRLRAGGSPGGHNGLLSIGQQLGATDFARLRVGIGRPRHGDPRDFVLSRFSATEEQALPEVVERAADAAETVVRDGILAAMNSFN